MRRVEREGEANQTQRIELMHSANTNSHLPDFDDTLVWKLVTRCHMTAEEAQAAYVKLEQEGKLDEAYRLIRRHERQESERINSDEVHAAGVMNRVRWRSTLALLWSVFRAFAASIRSFRKLLAIGRATLEQKGPAGPAYDGHPVWTISRLRRVGDGDSGPAIGGG